MAQSVNVGGNGGSFFERMVGSSDELLYGKGKGEVIDAEFAPSEEEDDGNG